MSERLAQHAKRLCDQQCGCSVCESSKKRVEKWVRLADAQNDKKELEGWLQRIRELVKNRDRWDKELSAKINYQLLQDRFELIEKELAVLQEGLAEKKREGDKR